MRRSVPLPFLFFVFIISAYGQESVTNHTNPPGLKWNQINTNNFRVLYPQGFDQQAQRMANTLEHIREPEAATMGVKPKKISVLLQNQSSISNGFVTLAPRRSEFFTMPSQDYNFTGNNDWLNLLASHEYRHIVQFQQSITGFNKLVYYVFGQSVLAGMAFVAAPQWFWEGDAVATETAFTHSGRGRIPNFDLLFRTNFLEGRTFNYHKQYLRSYKHNIPNHYVLGYHMVSYLRKKTGDGEIWNRIAKRAWNVPFIPFTFSHAIKKETGLHVVDLYNEMAAELKSKWTSEWENIKITPFNKVNPRSGNAYTDYQYPQPLEDGSVVVQKSGIGDIEKLVVLSEGQEKSRFVQGPLNDAGFLSTANSKVVWNEYRYNSRWLVKTYSMIVGYDFATGSKQIISKKSRYSSAALSPDGGKVATVESGTDYEVKLVVLDYSSGKILRKFNNTDNQFISMPRWSSDGKSIVALRLAPAGKAVVKYDYESGESTVLIPVTQENIGHPVLNGKYLFYNSPYSGIDNIYALDLETGKKFQVTSSKYGSYNPSVSSDARTLYYNEQTKNGLDVVKTEFDPYYWKPLEAVARPEVGYFQHLVDQEGHPDLLDSVPQKVYPNYKYSKLKNIFNIHSWGPYVSSDLSYLDIGISSKDLLNTTALDVGYRYDANEKTSSWRSKISYQALFPIIDVELITGKRNVTNTLFERDVNFKWDETGVSTGLRVPLLLTQSKYRTQLEFGNFVGITHVSNFSNEVTENGQYISSGTDRIVPANDTLYTVFTDKVSNGYLYFNRFAVSFSNNLKQSRRDFNPRFGQSFAFENYSTPFGGDFKGSLLVARGLFFFPGLFKHHSLYFRGGYQSKLSSYDLDLYTFQNRIFKPRGYSYGADTRFYSFAGNYELPLWYPDINLGPILNIQRIRANLFCDYGLSEGKSYFYRFNSNGQTEVYNLDNGAKYLSAGVEMMFDVNIMRFLPQFELGFRASYLTPNNYAKRGWVIEFLIGNIPF
ncbi:MAG: hypothetical protein AABY93_18415 [Bacteroidota bacterium]